ncbi:MAG: ABC transporter ATP-binding protein [Acidimicrobiia bacterium]|nr:ABC transporter ATP-binding protein [Acidimicrobiia bacterium]
MTATLAADPSASSAGSDVVLSLEGVTKEYPTTPPVRALRGVDFAVTRGELIGVVGPSGSGKSTLLHIMGTLDRPTAGEVTVAGYDVADLSDKDLSALRSRHIGFVFQQFHLLSGYTALDNVADGLLYTGLNVRTRRELARRALLRVDMGHRLHHVATKLSGGERQRVAVARALVGSPSIVLADEPTGNLDTKNSDAIVELIHQINEEGVTFVVITHNPDIAEAFPRTAGLRDGRIEYDTGVKR